MQVCMGRGRTQNAHRDEYSCGTNCLARPVQSEEKQQRDPGAFRVWSWVLGGEGSGWEPPPPSSRGGGDSPGA